MLAKSSLVAPVFSHSPPSPHTRLKQTTFEQTALQLGPKINFTQRRPPHFAMESGDDILALSRQTSYVDVSQEPRGYRRRPSAISRESFNSQKSPREADENTSLLEVGDIFHRRNYSSIPGTPRPRLSRHQSSLSPRTARTSRAASFTQRLTKALSSYDLKNKRDEPVLEDRVWYDQVGFSGAV